jgi:hypothetical protein
MAKGPRKGGFSSTADDNVIDIMRPQRDEPSLLLSVTSTNGNGIVDVTALDLTPFASIGLVSNHAYEISTNLIGNARRGTLGGHRNHLHRLVRYAAWFSERHGRAPETAAEVELVFTHQFYSFLVEEPTNENSKYGAMNWFKRFMLAIGVEPTIMAPNPFQHGSKGETDADLNTLSYEQARQILNQAKYEIDVVRRRAREGHRLARLGRDPRKQAGGERGAWSLIANRAWVAKRLLKRKWMRSEELVRTHRGVAEQLRAHEGPEIVSETGRAVRPRGVEAHNRWFYPDYHDLAPFVALMMLRTGWNMAVVAELQSRRWFKRYPHRVGAATGETHVYIVSNKVRGRKTDLSKPKEFRAVSARRPHSHPYRVLKSLEYITAGLRVELHRRLAELRAKAALTTKERAELQKLDSIKGDLLLFRSAKDGISSWRLMSLSTKDSFALKAFLQRVFYDRVNDRPGVVPITASQMRDAPILFSYETSGQNLFIAQLVANHSDAETTTLYLRRMQTLRRMWRDLANVMDASMKLIERGDFSAAAVRQMLRDQGLTARQVDNVLDPANRSRFGNGCADPENPPPGFDRHANGGGCRTQDCIDGCPYARWFNDSIDHLARELVKAERSFAVLGLESTDGSSLKSRIARCEALLERWPSDQREQAVARARARPAETDDLFLGAAL